MQYASYKIDGAKANDFCAAAMPLFADATIKAELQDRIINLDRATRSFELDVRGRCPAAILNLGKRFGTPANSYS